MSAYSRLLLVLVVFPIIACQPGSTGLTSMEHKPDDQPAVSLFCPEGASVEQCLQFDAVLAAIARSPDSRCAVITDRIRDQMHLHDGAHHGVYMAPTDPANPDRYGGSSYNESTRTFRNITVLYPKAFESDFELAMTLGHEAYGHQYQNNRSNEEAAEWDAWLCAMTLGN